MSKKLILLALVVVGGLFVLKKTELGSLVRVWWNDGKANLEASIDPETRIKQLRQELTQVQGRLKKAAAEQTRLEVAYDKMKADVEQLKTTQTTRARDMTALLKTLEAETKLVSSEANEAQSKLDTITRAYTNGKAALKDAEEILAERKKVVEAHDARIVQMSERHREMTLVVEKLEARLALLRLKQAENRVAESASEMAEAERLLQKLQTGLLEAEKRPEVEARYGLTPAKPETKRQSIEDSKKAARLALENDE